MRTAKRSALVRRGTSEPLSLQQEFSDHQHHHHHHRHRHLLTESTSGMSICSRGVTVVLGHMSACSFDNQMIHDSACLMD